MSHWNESESDASASSSAEATAEVGDLEQRLRRLEDAIASLQTTILAQKAATQPDGAPQTGNTRDSGITADPPKRSSSSAPQSPRREFFDRAVARDTWFILEVLGEIGTILRMFFDVRYRMAWWVRVFVVVSIAIVLFSHYFLLPFQITLFGVGQILDKIFALLIGYFLFKALSREARRYAAWRGERTER